MNSEKPSGPFKYTAGQRQPHLHKYYSDGSEHHTQTHTRSRPHCCSKIYLQRASPRPNLGMNRRCKTEVRVECTPSANEPPAMRMNPLLQRSQSRLSCSPAVVDVSLSLLLTVNPTAHSTNVVSPEQVYGITLMAGDHLSNLPMAMSLWLFPVRP